MAGLRFSHKIYRQSTFFNIPGPKLSRRLMKTIEVDGLSKSFGHIKAVDNISFDVEEGECFGLLGPNGAGKTTTLKLLATVLNPDSGSARIYGYSILDQKDEVRANLGMVFEEPSLDVQLTGRDNLDFHACMYHMPREERRKRIAEVLRAVGLEERADIPVKDPAVGVESSELQKNAAQNLYCIPELESIGRDLLPAHKTEVGVFTESSLCRRKCFFIRGMRRLRPQ